jgi:membrane protease YdiL (CAAX protease family)
MPRIIELSDQGVMPDQPLATVSRTLGLDAVGSAHMREQKRTRRNLLIFAVVVLASGWLGYGLDRLLNNPPAQQLGLLLWLVAPLITALLLRAFAGDGWRDFGLNPSLKGNGIWYAASLLIYPLVAALVLTIGSMLGLVTFSDLPPVLLLSIFAGALVPSFIKNIFEEFAWRGYLAPKVHALGLNASVGHVIVGLIWGGWHIPYLLFLLDPAVRQATTTQSMVTFIPLMIAGLIAASLVYGELRLLTGSVWPAVLLHTMGNAFVDLLILQGLFKIVPGLDFLVAPGPQSVLTLSFFVAIGLGLRHLRTRKQAATALTGAPGPMPAPAAP